MHLITLSDRPRVNQTVSQPFVGRIARVSLGKLSMREHRSQSTFDDRPQCAHIGETPE